MIKSKQITLKKQNPSKCLLKDCLVDSYFFVDPIMNGCQAKKNLWFDLEALDDSLR